MATVSASDVHPNGPKCQEFTGGIQLTGSARIFSGAVAPTDGTTGTGAGKAGPGSMYLRTDSAAVYINTGTKASPTWKAVTHA